MMLRHLRSLVVAYDHLSEDRRKKFTTALEIIKNREVLNMVSCGGGYSWKLCCGITKAWIRGTI